MIMGCDIHGFVEVKQDNAWSTHVDIRRFVDRNYAMFGLLFGVCNYNNYPSVADHRGIPDDVAPITQRESREWGNGHSHSWISYSEIVAIDWEHGKGTTLCDRTSVYKKGEEEPFMQFLWGGEITKEDKLALGKGETIEKIGPSGDLFLYRREVQSFKDAQSFGWSALIERMKILAEQHGPENVRLVVWFDS